MKPSYKAGICFNRRHSVPAALHLVLDQTGASPRPISVSQLKSSNMVTFVLCS